MKIEIRYFTKSNKGNTKKLADAVSAALGIEALDVSADLAENVDRLFLINAMYAANIDKEVSRFLERNGDKIGEIVNMNTSASLRQALEILDRYHAPVEHIDLVFQRKASFPFQNKERKMLSTIQAARE